MIRKIKEKVIALLRWSEKYFKADMVYFFKGNFWINVNRGLAILNGLALSFAFGHLLTKEAYGTYTYVFAVTGLFSMPMTTGLGAGVSKAIPRGHDATIFESMRRILPWSIAAAIMLAGVGAYYWIFGNAILGVSFVLGAIIMPSSIAFGAAKAFLNLKGNFKLTTTYNSWRTPIVTAILIITALVSPHALSIIVVTMVTNILISGAFYFQVKRLYGLKPGPLSDAEPFAGKFAFHAGLLSIFGYLDDQVDDLLLWRFVGAAPVAVYTYAMAPVIELRNLVENQSTIAAPKFAQKEFSEVKKTLNLRIKQLYFLAIPIIILYILLAPLMYRILFPQYLASVWLSQIAVLSLLSTPRKLMTTAITTHQKVKESYITTIMPSAVRIGLACVMVPLYGIEGAVFALIISEVIDYIVLGFLMRSASRHEV